MNENAMKLPEKCRSDIIDTVAQHRDEVRALKWLIVLFLLTLAYEFGPQIVADYAISGIEIREPEVQTSRKPLPAKRVSRVIRELTIVQNIFPIVRSSLRSEIEILESFKEFRPEKVSAGDREKKLGECLERLWVFISKPTWEDQTIFAAAKSEIQTIMTLMKRKLPEASELPPLPVRNSRILLMEIPSRDIFAYGTATESKK